MFKDGRKKFLVGDNNYADTSCFMDGLYPLVTYELYLSGADPRPSEDGSKVVYQGKEYELLTKYDESFSFGEGYRPYIFVDGKDLMFDMVHRDVYADGISIQTNEDGIIHVGDRCYIDSHPEELEHIKVVPGEYHGWQEIEEDKFGKKTTAFGITNEKRASRANSTQFVRTYKNISVDSGMLSMWSNDKAIHEHRVSDGDYELLYKIDDEKNVIGLAIAMSKPWVRNNAKKYFVNGEVRD
jgi:hypothetical protein